VSELVSKARRELNVLEREGNVGIWNRASNWGGCQIFLLFVKELKGQGWRRTYKVPNSKIKKLGNRRGKKGNSPGWGDGCPRGRTVDALK